MCVLIFKLAFLKLKNHKNHAKRDKLVNMKQWHPCDVLFLLFFSFTASDLPSCSFGPSGCHKKCYARSSWLIPFHCLERDQEIVICKRLENRLHLSETSAQTTSICTSQSTQHMLLQKCALIDSGGIKSHAEAPGSPRAHFQEGSRH